MRRQGADAPGLRPGWRFAWCSLCRRTPDRSAGAAPAADRKIRWWLSARCWNRAQRPRRAVRSPAFFGSAPVALQEPGVRWFPRRRRSSDLILPVPARRARKKFARCGSVRRRAQCRPAQSGPRAAAPAAGRPTNWREKVRPPGRSGARRVLPPNSTSERLRWRWSRAPTGRAARWRWVPRWTASTTAARPQAPLAPVHPRDLSAAAPAIWMAAACPLHRNRCDARFARAAGVHRGLSVRCRSCRCALDRASGRFQAGAACPWWSRYRRASGARPSFDRDRGPAIATAWRLHTISGPRRRSKRTRPERDPDSWWWTAVLRKRFPAAADRCSRPPGATVCKSAPDWRQSAQRRPVPRWVRRFSPPPP